MRIGFWIVFCGVAYLLGAVVLLGLHLDVPALPAGVVPSTTPAPCSAGGVQCYLGSAP
jgi:hypothetical protein